MTHSEDLGIDSGPQPPRFWMHKTYPMIRNPFTIVDAVNGARRHFGLGPWESAMAFVDDMLDGVLVHMGDGRFKMREKQ